jgi:hypothetical protein
VADDFGSRLFINTGGDGGAPPFIGGGNGGPLNYGGGSGGPPNIGGGNGGPLNYAGGSGGPPKFGGCSGGPPPKIVGGGGIPVVGGYRGPGFDKGIYISPIFNGNGFKTGAKVKIFMLFCGYDTPILFYTNNY